MNKVELLTQSAPHGACRARQLEDQGQEAVWVPALKIEPIKGVDVSVLEGLRNNDVLFVVSRHAATLLAGLAGSMKAVDFNCWAPGEATGKVLSDLASKFSGQLNVRCPRLASSEGLLDDADFQSQIRRSGQLLVVAGVGGRTLVQDRVAALGTHVERLELYRRQGRVLSGEEIRQLRLMSERSVNVSLMSASVIEALESHWPQTVLRDLKCQQATCPSARVASIAKRFGWTNVVLTGPDRSDET